MMKNFFTMSVLALCLTGVGVAQQEISPDHFEEAASQPTKVKRVIKSNPNAAHVAQAKHRVSKKPGNKTVLAARNTAGN